jgi:hypothetical protein
LNAGLFQCQKAFADARSIVEHAAFCDFEGDLVPRGSN